MMTRDQLKYAMSRAEAILAVRKVAAGLAFTKPEAKLASAEEIRDALLAGRFSVIEHPAPIHYGNAYLRSFITFSDEAESTTDHVGLRAEQERLEAEYRKITDELMLGDNVEALALLQAFERAE